MTRGRRSPGAALLVAALLALPSPAALGASSSRHRKHKAKRPTPAAVNPRPAEPDGAETPPPPDDDADADSAPEPERTPVAREPAERGRAGDAEAKDDATPVPVPAKPVPSPKSDGDGPRLGRREAARLAAGRIEVAVSIGIDVGRRQFTYSDPIGDMPRPYRLLAAPLATFGLEAYPLASTDIPFLRDLGFRGRVSRAFALDSSTTNGAPLDDSWTRFAGEIRERLLVGGTHPLELGVAVGVDASYFDLGTKADVGALVPSARTLSLRFGLDARVAVTERFSLLVGGAYLATLSRGEIYDRFRRPRVAGVDAELAVALTVTPGLEVRLGGRYTRYFSSFDPQVGDAAVAGGALDEQIQAGVGLRYAH